ncbi:hypothetical protein [Streptomyces sp. NPDC048825]|uniref:hypothetical protein n=1 Tax=Streptomyces sp. NPDC048825 TaxID=3365592 RepID=UPI0037176D76
MTGRGMRWAGLVGAVGVSLAGAFSVVLPWARGGERSFPGVDAGDSLESYVSDVIHPVVQFYLVPVFAWSFVAFLLATTAGVRASWARFVAAAVALLPTALLCLGIMIASDPGPYAEPYEVRSQWICAAAIAVLLALLLAAVVALLRRVYRVYHWFVVAFLVGLGALHLAAIGLFAATLHSDVQVTGYAWLPGAGYILAGVFAAFAARGAAALAEEA